MKWGLNVIIDNVLAILKNPQGKKLNSNQLVRKRSYNARQTIENHKHIIGSDPDRSHSDPARGVNAVFAYGSNIEINFILNA